MADELLKALERLSTITVGPNAPQIQIVQDGAKMAFDIVNEIARQALSEIKAEAEYWADENDGPDPFITCQGRIITVELGTVWDPGEAMDAVANVLALSAKDDPNPPEAGEQSGWRLIESAPRDGTPIDIWVEGYPSRRVVNMKWDDHEWGFLNTQDPEQGWMEDETPTHYMPLPASPSPGGR